MDIYVALKREEFVVIKGITVYDEEGKEVHRAIKTPRVENPGKFDAQIDAMTWGIRQFRKLEEQKKIEIEVEEKVKIYTENKTIYGWIKKGESPERYIIPFSELMLELSLMGVETEVHLIEGHMVKFREEKEELERVTDILDEFNIEE